MMSQARRALLALVMALVSLLGASSGSVRSEEPVNKSRAVLDAWLAKVMQSISIKIEPKVILIEDDGLQKIFPGNSFYGVYLPRWPVAIRTPKELSYENVIVVRQDESIEPIRDGQALTSFLTQALANIQDEPRARLALLGSLRLAEAGAKDGPYQFDDPQISITRQKKNIVGSARAAVHEPGSGEVTIRIEFGPDGRAKPDGIEIDGRPRRGAPPR
jgi:hypothetical protein